MALITTIDRAQAHTRGDLELWMEEWIERADDSLSPGLVMEYQDMRQRHLWYFDPQPIRSNRTYRTWNVNAGVEQWRSLVAQYFRAEDVDRALCLMWYESRGDPNAYNSSGASGLMQVMASWAVKFGVSKDALFDPATNLRIASQLREISWNQWNPYKRGLCR